MSKRANRDTPQGLKIEFDNAKEIVEILLIPEKENKHRYKNVCILGDDDFKIACSDRDYQAGEQIKFIKEFSKEYFRAGVARTCLIYYFSPRYYNLSYIVVGRKITKFKFYVRR